MDKLVLDLEFRWSDTNQKYQLVQWIEAREGKEYCYVVAFFEKTDEGCDIRFVGPRPFDYANQETLWAMLKYGHAIVSAEVDLEQATKYV